MASRWAIMAAIIVIAVASTGCAGAAAPEVVDDAAAVVPSDIDDATSGDADLDGEADEGASLTAEEFCGFLAEESPGVLTLSPPEYAFAVFGSAVFDFYTEKGLLTDIDGADMDSLAAEGCPDAAAALLPVLGADSFAAAFSQ